MSKSWTFVVTGRGLFPEDMLRYDQAYPIDGDGINIDRRAPDFYERRAVRMRSLSPSGPTVGRWNSFGWLVTDIEKGQ